MRYCSFQLETPSTCPHLHALCHCADRGLLAAELLPQPGRLLLLARCRLACICQLLGKVLGPHVCGLGLRVSRRLGGLGISQALLEELRLCSNLCDWATPTN